VSSDLIDDLSDAHGVSLGLVMNVHGHVFLTLHGVINDHGHDRDAIDFDIVTLHLPPTADGHAQAKIIENALREWREHTTFTEEQL
jgi:hypothetical protein